MPKDTAPQTTSIPAADINRRFLEAVIQIAANNAASGGPYGSRKAVAESIGLLPQNIPGNGKNATATACADLCHTHGISPAWLLLGQGEMLATAQREAEARMEAIEERLKKLEGKS